MMMMTAVGNEDSMIHHRMHVLGAPMVLPELTACLSLRRPRAPPMSIYNLFECHVCMFQASWC